MAFTFHMESINHLEEHSLLRRHGPIEAYMILYEKLVHLLKSTQKKYKKSFNHKVSFVPLRVWSWPSPYSHRHSSPFIRLIPFPSIHSSILKVLLNWWVHFKWTDVRRRRTRKKHFHSVSQSVVHSVVRQAI